MIKQSAQTFLVETCSGCEHLKRPDDYLGPRRCIGFGKKKRNGKQFKSSDPKYKAPKWCPKRLSPAVVRIYQKNYGRSCLHDMVARMHPESASMLLTPRAGDYDLAYECRYGITSKRFYEIAKENLDEAANMFGHRLRYGDVVEIDNGFTPYFFYYVIEGIKLLYWPDRPKNKTTEEIQNEKTS